MASLYGPNQLTQEGKLTPNTDCFGVASMTPGVFHDRDDARSLSTGLARLNRMVRLRRQTAMRSIKSASATVREEHLLPSTINQSK